MLRVSMVPGADATGAGSHVRPSSLLNTAVREGIICTVPAAGARAVVRLIRCDAGLAATAVFNGEQSQECPDRGWLPRRQMIVELRADLVAWGELDDRLIGAFLAQSRGRALAGTFAV